MRTLWRTEIEVSVWKQADGISTWTWQPVGSQDPIAEERSTSVIPHLFLSHMLSPPAKSSRYQCGTDGPHNSSSFGNMKNPDLHLCIVIVIDIHYCHHTHRNGVSLRRGICQWNLLWQHLSATVLFCCEDLYICIFLISYYTLIY
jgi:hypothetical protein